MPHRRVQTDPSLLIYNKADSMRDVKEHVVDATDQASRHHTAGFSPHHVFLRAGYSRFLSRATGCAFIILLVAWAFGITVLFLEFFFSQRLRQLGPRF